MTTSKRKTIIAGNWKMHKTRAEARELAKAIVDGVKGEKDLPEVVLVPPFTSIPEVLQVTSGTSVQVGAQNMDWRDSGAFTGEIAPPMLTELGVKYVLIGHSERRQFFGETNATVNQRLKAALKHGLIPIVCVGESLDEREEGLTDSVVRRQVGAALSEIEPGALESIIIAYEPVWAIGTGKVCEAKEAGRVAAVIRATVTDLYAGAEMKGGQKPGAGNSVPILYGG
ncbi:MAG TPA: triose-phosphate isomerase, partial [Candidatus Obscuribacterales bacterium]